MDSKARICICAILCSFGILQAIAGSSVEDDTDDAAKRQEALDALLEESSVIVEKWQESEEEFKAVQEFGAARVAQAAQFISDELNGVDVTAILPEQVIAIKGMFEATVAMLRELRARKEFFASGITLLHHWRAVLELEEVQIAECEELLESGFENAYDLEISFNDLEVIYDGLMYTFGEYIADVSFEWTGCVLDEMASVIQGQSIENTCEANVARESRFAAVLVGNLIRRLIKAGERIDNALTRYKQRITSISDVEECVEIEGLLGLVEDVENIGVLRRENEQMLKTVDAEMLNAMTQWLNSFLTSLTDVKREKQRDENKEEVVDLLKTLLKMNSKK